MTFSRLLVTSIRGQKTGLKRFSDDTRALIFNTASCGIFGFVGDGLAQWFERWQEKGKSKTGTTTTCWDLRRSLLFGVAHLSLGPVLHFFYRAIDRRWPLRTFSHVRNKVVADYAFASPYFAMFFASYCLLFNSGTFDEYKRYCREKIPIYLAIDLFLWCPLQWMNFMFVPVWYRVVMTKFVELFFNFIMSFVAHNDIDLEQVVGSLLKTKKD